MADVQHADISEAYLHEAKGASSATLGQLLTAVGDGTATFQEPSTYELVTEDSLTIEDFDDQLLTTQYEESQIFYSDSEETSPNGAITISTDGMITINEAGLYYVRHAGECGRSTSVGTARLAFAIRSDGVQVGKTTVISIPTSDTTFTWPVNFSTTRCFEAGDVLSLWMARLDDEAGDAGLVSTTLDSSLTDWNNSPSVRFDIFKFGVE